MTVAKYGYGRPNPGWAVVDYGTCIDVTPVEDKQPHGAGDECWCMPRVKNKFRSIVIHNSSDNREAYEPPNFKDMIGDFESGR